MGRGNDPSKDVIRRHCLAPCHLNESRLVLRLFPLYARDVYGPLEYCPSGTPRRRDYTIASAFMYVKVRPILQTRRGRASWTSSLGDSAFIHSTVMLCTRSTLALQTAQVLLHKLENDCVGVGISRAL